MNWLLAAIPAVALSSCAATPPPMTLEESHRLWAAQLYPDEYLILRDFLHLNKKEIGLTEGVTVLALPSFHALVGIEIIHKIRPGPNELNSPDQPKHWMNESIFTPDVQTAEDRGDYEKFVTQIEKYRVALSAEQYEVLITEVAESGILSLPKNVIPEFDCFDGITVHADILTASIQRFEARHVCDDGFESVKLASEAVFSFLEQRIPEMTERLNQIRQYY